MKALGRDSVASLIKIGLLIAWVVLWIVAGCMLAVALYWALVQIGLAPAGDLGDVAWTVVLPAFAVGVVAIGGALIIVWRLRRLFDSFSSGEPFRRENAHHLRVIWMTMLGIELSRFALMAGTRALFAVYGDPGVEDFSIRIDAATWGSILILIVLAEVFREGARLKEEQELTI